MDEQPKTVEEINIERRNQLQAMIEEDERKQREIKERARSLIDIIELLKSDEVKRVYFEEITDKDGNPTYLDYCKLNTAETSELMDIKDQYERDLFEFKKRVGKATPDLVAKTIDDIPYIYIQLFLLKVREEENTRFLLPLLQNVLNTSKLRQMQEPS